MDEGVPPGGGGLLRWGPYLCLQQRRLTEPICPLPPAAQAPEWEGWRTLQQRPPPPRPGAAAPRRSRSYVLEYQVQGLLADKTEGDGESEKMQSHVSQVTPPRRAWGSASSEGC